MTEEKLAVLFLGCGQVVDCRVRGDANFVLRFAFVEFTDQEVARTWVDLHIRSQYFEEHCMLKGVHENFVGIDYVIFGLCVFSFLGTWSDFITFK
ncbi:PREDICTED: polyadenylate-binding protein-interacting protein 11-like isoform X1 [Erythranthe guttata]|uniref:polyadenylate-binding protein-interacting protein 11-like isoform X1 n=1 Tax=Erythranthe guttata TaxID=4155 RepID=UPI00064DA120|nr:PREDICTED: polyadenylate-binding protein-interacting protein 11-like isoform X1 [Erythranthe guttata]XP_012851039.1 PREDICTED: polyadenylate-binding protein-interacting protein 11-like isoform X1 [Erythranthe guttata]XP_012851040.1 PREDICTED: polyadenylate-binding protein-interacting protein 11-like isoform X2 [Erythranthe guttata]XP_012851041.1 PREDICTED: polyadenylate-binding protein-interacting protein 11-like isoform X1 [Erythranthe guttata]|eukprot:XP_012851038.1 PREDICTED: polyadenylate-binding protein-interacting protein 11-like isoform X1 [Erythranthe guttata]